MRKLVMNNQIVKCVNYTYINNVIESRYHFDLLSDKIVLQCFTNISFIYR